MSSSNNGHTEHLRTHEMIEAQNDQMVGQMSEKIKQLRSVSLIDHFFFASASYKVPMWFVTEVCTSALVSVWCLCLGVPLLLGGGFINICISEVPVKEGVH